MHMFDLKYDFRATEKKKTINFRKDFFLKIDNNKLVHKIKKHKRRKN